MPRGRTKTQYYQLGGGLDIVTPALTVNPGALLAAVNFEPWYNGGYRRIDGFERIDGQPKPSDATFLGFEVDTITGLVLGTTVTGSVSGTTGVIVGFDDVGTPTMGVTKVTGGTGFEDGETLSGSGTQVIANDPTLLFAPTVDLEDIWLLESEDSYREDILKLPGAGAPTGGWQRGSNIYGFRNNAGETIGEMWLASASGWTQSGITLAQYVFFDGGGGGTARALPVEGDTIVGVDSSASGTLHRIILHQGSTTNNDAEGYLVLTGITGGTFQDSEELRENSIKFADSASAQATVEFSPGGHYRFQNHNFFAGATTFRTYVVNGVDPGFEIDENNVVSPVLFPLNDLGDQPANNIPFDIEEHKNTLFFAFPGGSVQATIPGDPLVFNGFLGAAEYGLGDEITGMNSIVGQVLVLTTERETRGLFGDPASLLGQIDLEMKLIGEKTGGKLFTVQKVDTVYALDDLGITNISRTDAFGDFVGATVSSRVQPLINALRENVTDSTIIRESNQYRVYFDNNEGIIMYVPAGSQTRSIDAGESRLAEFGFLSYPFPVRKIWNTDDDTGKERTYFVSDDGYLYEDQIGKNFDGEEIQSYIRTAFNQVGSPAYKKRFRRVDLELSTPHTLVLKFVADLTYSAAEVSSGISDIIAIDIPEIRALSGGGFWDTANWDEFLWDGAIISTARADINGSGENIGFLIFNESAFRRPFILQGITLHYDLRRLQR